MNKYIYLLLLLTLCNCKNKNSTSATASTANQSKNQSKHPTLIPSNLTFNSTNLTTVLNTQLFDRYELDKDQTAIAKTDLKTSDFTYKKDFVNYLELSSMKKPRVYGAKELLNITLSFSCDECKNAYFFKRVRNKDKTSADFKELLKDPSVMELSIERTGELYQFHSNGYTLKSTGFVGFYIVLQDKDGQLFIYEIAGANSDASAPVFEDAEYCSQKHPENSFDGMVCITTKDFKGNDYLGYDVPIKGLVLGDVAVLKIFGKDVSFTKGEFFTRMQMKLTTGYNQIPIEVSDHFGNTTISYIEVELESLE